MPVPDVWGHAFLRSLVGDTNRRGSRGVKTGRYVTASGESSVLLSPTKGGPCNSRVRMAPSGLLVRFFWDPAGSPGNLGTSSGAGVPLRCCGGGSGGGGPGGALGVVGRASRGAPGASPSLTFLLLCGVRCAGGFLNVLVLLNLPKFK